jgi:cyclophilin family peptidyl-prolyl cis-trans isomerase
MAEHKAPTEVTVVAGDEPSRLALFVEKHWVKGAAVALAVAAFILFSQFQAEQEVVAVNQSWSRLMTSVEEDGMGRLAADPELLAGLEAELDGTVAGAWGLYLKAQGLRAEGRYDEAIATLASLAQRYPDHPLVTEKRIYGESITPLNAIERLNKVFASEKEWQAGHPELFANPTPSANAPRVRFQTEAGDFVVALYPEQAPLHAANFLEQVNEGVYNGLKFHRAAFGQMIDTGDPSTGAEDSDPMTWGRQGVEGSIESEETGLYHFEGALSANKVAGEEDSNASLVSILAQAAHYRDGTNVVFGTVVEGLDIVRDIAGRPSDPTGQRPLEPVTIQTASVIPGT